MADRGLLRVTPFAGTRTPASIAPVGPRVPVGPACRPSHRAPAVARAPALPPRARAIIARWQGRRTGT